MTTTTATMMYVYKTYGDFRYEIECTKVHVNMNTSTKKTNKKTLKKYSGIFIFIMFYI